MCYILFKNPLLEILVLFSCTMFLKALSFHLSHLVLQSINHCLPVRRGVFFIIKHLGTHNLQNSPFPRGFAIHYTHHISSMHVNTGLFPCLSTTMPHCTTTTLSGFLWFSYYKSFNFRWGYFKFGSFITFLLNLLINVNLSFFAILNCALCSFNVFKESSWFFSYRAHRSCVTFVLRHVTSGNTLNSKCI